MQTQTHSNTNPVKEYSEKLLMNYLEKTYYGKDKTISLFIDTLKSIEDNIPYIGKIEEPTNIDELLVFKKGELKLLNVETMKHIQELTEKTMEKFKKVDNPNIFCKEPSQINLLTTSEELNYINNLIDLHDDGVKIDVNNEKFADFKPYNSDLNMEEYRLKYQDGDNVIISKYKNYGSLEEQSSDEEYFSIALDIKSVDDANTKFMFEFETESEKILKPLIFGDKDDIFTISDSLQDINIPSVDVKIINFKCEFLAKVNKFKYTIEFIKA